MSERDDRLDQRELAALWRLEGEDRADRRVELQDLRVLSLFLDVLDGRSYLFEHGSDPEAATEALNVGDAEFERYETAAEARTAFADRLRELQDDGQVVDTDADEDVGDVNSEGPILTETGEENLEET
ncbi:MAG TPA: hypothetical protein VF137_00690 [Candidatus Dormibacteraeota bacterium]